MGSYIIRNMGLYEYTRTQRRHHGKKRLVMIPVQMRSQMLLDAGFTQEEIIERALEVAEIQRQREETTLAYLTRGSSSSQFHGFGKLLSKNYMSGLKSLRQVS